MSKFRREKRSLKAVLFGHMSRMKQRFKSMLRQGMTPAQAMRAATKKARGNGSRDRSHWRRWYKANKKHQRQFAALRQAGANVRNIPHSLNASWVR